MDELLHPSDETSRAGGALTDHFSAAASAAREKAAAAEDILRPRAKAAASWLRRNPISPLVFLAASAVIGVGAVVSTQYAPAYAVSVDGVNVGTVKNKLVFESIVNTAELRATRILGYDYSFDEPISYQMALVPKDEFSNVADLETYVLSQIGEVMQSYVLTVNGTTVGAADSSSALQSVLDQVAAPYLTDNTIEHGFVDDVNIVTEYISSETTQDASQMLAALTANTSGQTTYAVVDGDTFGAIAQANGMTSSELQALNPGVDINKIYIGQVLTVKETVPFLSVYTVDKVTYNQAIASPVEYVEDSSMYVGKTKVVTQGSEGAKSVTADVTYVNGQESKREVLSETVVTEATATVIAKGTKEKPKTVATGSFIYPVSGFTMSSRYGYRSIFGSYSFHSGLDLACPYGTSIKASDGGTVIFAGYSGNYGYLVKIDHGNGFVSYYGHCSSLLVSAGDKVYQGQVIAKVGSTGRATGNHCHFELRLNGSTVNPLKYL